MTCSFCSVSLEGERREEAGRDPGAPHLASNIWEITNAKSVVALAMSFRFHRRRFKLVIRTAATILKHPQEIQSCH